MVAEGKQLLNKTKESFVKRSAELVENTISNALRSEIAMLKEDITAAKENEFGRKISAYKGSLSLDGIDRDVDFFQVGRVALLYQTTDSEISGARDNEARNFVQLDKSEYRSAIRAGLRIARKEATIDILKLPISAPEAAE